MSEPGQENQDTWSTDLGALVHGLEETIQSNLIADMLAGAGSALQQGQATLPGNPAGGYEGALADLLLSPEDSLEAHADLIAPSSGSLSLSFDDADGAGSGSTEPLAGPAEAYTDVAAPHIGAGMHALGILFVLDDGSNTQSGLG